MSTPVTAGVGRGTHWTADNVIERIQRWHALYGAPPRAADWNPSSAKWAAQTWRIPRYLAGDPETGEPWPSLNAAKRPFDGSLNAAVRAAGFQPARPGPHRRRDVTPEVLERLPIPGEVRVALEAGRERAAAAEERAGIRDRQLERARGRIHSLEDALETSRRVTRDLRDRVERPRVVTRTRTVTRDRTDEAALERARVKARGAEGRAVLAASDAALAARTAREEVKEARTTATRLAARLERAEATIAELRGERRSLKAAATRAEDRQTAAERRLEDARATVEVVKPEIIMKDAPEAAVVREAQREAMLSRREADAAAVRAAAAERGYRELAAAVTGEPRRLSVGELKELRSKGPAGPVLLAAALKKLARARSGRGSMAEALVEVAQAAVSWKERL